MLKQVFKKSSLLLAASAMFVFTACQGEAAGKASDEDITSDEARELAPVTESNSENDANALVNSDSQDIVIEQAQEFGGNASTSGVRINPPHGEPGHDCAVPVGDPLPASGSVAPISPMAVPNTPPAPQNISIPNTPMNNTAVRINPPHGEPGHDCAVPVGDPLP